MDLVRRSCGTYLKIIGHALLGNMKRRGKICSKYHKVTVEKVTVEGDDNSGARTHESACHLQCFVLLTYSSQGIVVVTVAGCSSFTVTVTVACCWASLCWVEMLFSKRSKIAANSVVNPPTRLFVHSTPISWLSTPYKKTPKKTKVYHHIIQHRNTKTPKHRAYLLTSSHLHHDVVVGRYRSSTSGESCP